MLCPMGRIRYSVTAESEDAVRAERERLCRLLGADPVGSVLQPVGRDETWMARAERRDQPAGGGSVHGA